LVGKITRSRDRNVHSARETHDSPELLVETITRKRRESVAPSAIAVMVS
jgi:hypothetical protein